MKWTTTRDTYNCQSGWYFTYSKNST